MYISFFLFLVYTHARTYAWFNDQNVVANLMYHRQNSLFKGYPLCKLQFIPGFPKFIVKKVHANDDSPG